MTNLTDKFGTFEEQVAVQHNELVTLLNGLTDGQSAQYELMQQIKARQDENTQLIISAILANNACSCSPTSPLVGTPPVTSPTSESSDFCKRVQAFLRCITLFADYADAVGFNSGVFTTGYVTQVVEEVRTTMDDPGIPVPGWIDTLAIAADGVNFVINRALFGGGARDTLDPLLASLQSAMFSSGDPSAAKAAYDGIIDGSSGLAASKPLLKGLAYGDLVNYFLSPDSDPNLAGYDGFACGVTECFDIASVLTTFVDSSTLQAISWEYPIEGQNHTPAGYSSDHNTWAVTDLTGWSYSATAETRYLQQWNDTPTTLASGASYTFLDWDLGAIIAGAGGAAFTITLCPPGS